VTLEGKPLAVVADDEDDILALLSAALSAAGCDVVPAHDGEAALRLIQERSPQIAVLDISMPRLDGLEVLRRLRADVATTDLPVILVSARAQEADVKLGYAEGASRYVRKPFSPRELAAVARELLAPR
jgi:two-component system, OmpR family, phosphate regulon response regulator PhoB